MRTLSPDAWNRLLRRSRLMWRHGAARRQAAQDRDAARDPEPDAIYRRLVSQWDRPDEIAGAAASRAARCGMRASRATSRLFVPRMQFLDMVTYLPDDILTKVDRATMAVGLEGRVPLLDHRVVAYAWSLPQPIQGARRQGKWLLRQVLDRYVPRQLIDRPKMGFGVPIDGWLRGPLREWAETLLSPARLASYGFVRVEPVRRAWQEHLSGAATGSIRCGRC